MGDIKDSLANIHQGKRRHNRRKLNFYSIKREDSILYLYPWIEKLVQWINWVLFHYKLCTLLNLIQLIHPLLQPILTLHSTLEAKNHQGLDNSNSMFKTKGCWLCGDWGSFCDASLCPDTYCFLFWDYKLEYHEDNFWNSSHKIGPKLAWNINILLFCISSK